MLYRERVSGGNDLDIKIRSTKLEIISNDQDSKVRTGEASPTNPASGGENPILGPFCDQALCIIGVIVL